MNHLTTFKPYLGVIVFGDKNRHKNYLQIHDITDKGWGEGKPFDRESLAALATSIKSEQMSSLKLRGLLPENVLYFQPGAAGNRFMWWLPPGKHMLQFKPDLKIRSREYDCPGLIFAVNHNTLCVYAFKGSEKPTEKTELYHAPFFNVYDNGAVCMGTVSEARRRAFLDEELDRWERRFFGGRSTSEHGLETRLAKGWKIKELYRQMCTAFPDRALKPAPVKTLKDLVTRLINERRNQND